MSYEEGVRAWLNFAEADRKSAHNALKAADYRDAAFHCQQAVEKLLKAIIVAQTGKRPPYIHDLRTLLRRVRGVAIPKELVRHVSDMDVYYIGTRYPGAVVNSDVFSEENISSLIDHMEDIFRWFLANVDLERK